MANSAKSKFYEIKGKVTEGLVEFQEIYDLVQENDISNIYMMLPVKRYYEKLKAIDEPIAYLAKLNLALIPDGTNTTALITNNLVDNAVRANTDKYTKEIADLKSKIKQLNKDNKRLQSENIKLASQMAQIERGTQELTEQVESAEPVDIEICMISFILNNLSS
jgi:chromosome segregation ATPase